MKNIKLQSKVWYTKAKKKAVVKEFLSNGLIRITYFDAKDDSRVIKDVLRDSLEDFNSPIGNKYYYQVREFHNAFGLPVAESPRLLSNERKQSRLTWMREELQEYEDSTTIKDEVDAMIDEIYFCIGTLVEMGVKPDRIFDAVQKSNMGKLWADGKPRYREGDGKIVKPPTWSSPDVDILRELFDQMNARK
jgi:predicted HAD superfamily Cof-like phosphohydrolase